MCSSSEICPGFAWRTDEHDEEPIPSLVRDLNSRFLEDETEVLFIPMRHSLPYWYRVMQLANLQLYEKQPTPALLLFPSTINLNYWTASDRLSPMLPLFFTKNSSHFCRLFTTLSLPWSYCNYLTTVLCFMTSCGLVYAYKPLWKEYTLPVLNINQIIQFQNPEHLQYYYFFPTV
jgi:hypothetical protein